MYYNPKRGLIDMRASWVFLKGVLPAAEKDLLILLIYLSTNLLIESIFAPKSKAMDKQVKPLKRLWKTVETPLEARWSHFDPHQSQILSIMSKKTEGLNLVGWLGRVLKFRGRKSCNQVLKRVRD